MERQFTISTKPDKNGKEVQTVVTVDFEGYTLEHAVQHFFTSTSPRVALQAKLRAAKGGIPTAYSCKATDLLGRIAPIMSVEQLVASMTPAQREQIKAALGM